MNPTHRPMFRVKRVGLLLCLLILSLLAACSPNRPSFIPSAVTGSPVGPDGGIVSAQFPDGFVSALFPSGSLSAVTDINIGVVGNAPLALFPPGVTLLGDVYYIGDICLELANGSTATVVLPFPAGTGPGQRAAASVYYSSIKGDWTALPRTDRPSGVPQSPNGEVAGITRDLCMFAVGTTGDGGIEAPDIITDFRARPSTIRRGDNSTLSWSVADVEDVDLTVSITPGIGPVGRESQQNVQPNRTTQYTLEVRLEPGATVRSTVEVQVPAAVSPVDPLSLRANAGQSDTGSVTFSNVGGLGPDGVLNYTLGTFPSWLSLENSDRRTGTLQPDESQTLNLRGTCPVNPTSSELSATVDIFAADSPFDGSFTVNLECVLPPGILELTVVGLPNGQTANITLRGPNLDRNITLGSETRVFNDLPPGNYTISAPNVGNLTPRPNLVGIDIASGQTERVVITYGPQ